MSVPSVNYEHGFLSEVLNEKWDSIYLEPIEHMYVITNAKTHREQWHVHNHTVDRYLLIQGEVEVALFDNRENSESHKKLERLTLTSLGTDGPQGLRIPAGVWHTFRSLSDGFILLNSKTPGYNRENPDKYVLPFQQSEITFNW